MSAIETSLGGLAGGFPETTWGLVCRIRNPRAPEFHAGIEALCRRYWKSVYRFARAAWAKSNDDAKDLTQAFFLWLLEDGDALTKYAPERGSFRAYLKGLLRNFSGNQLQAMQRLKRGGGFRRFSLDDPDSALAEAVPDPRTATPEDLFDRAWIAEVVKRSTERARLQFESDGSARWRVFQEYDLGASPERPTYEEVAKRLGIKESDVRNHLFTVRDKIRAFIREELRDTVTCDEEVQEEWRALFGA